jgi:hypothetical protein
MLTAQVSRAFVRGACSRVFKINTCGSAPLTTYWLAQGHLFHIDFEYILGNDPKPFAPPMKLCEQMVVAMGGRTSKVRVKNIYARANVVQLSFSQIISSSV